MSNNPGNDLADECAEKLSEHFESVMIIATVYEGPGEEGGSGTRVVCKRRGNYYATKGAVTEWLEEERNRDLADKLRPDQD